MMPAILAVVAQAVELNEEAHARHLLDVVETLLILETPLLSKSIPQLVQFTITAGQNRAIEDDIRNMCLNALNWTVQ
jgi:importin-4